MSAVSKAIYLSYAREDAETARRLAEAMRAVGVEAWFEPSETRGGQGWEAKMRKQIKECALFVPVISANTQARNEGFFRQEWKLADQRTRVMGKNATFILPVCLDATRDEDADVPGSFLKVQWTRFPVRRDKHGKVQSEPDDLDVSDFAGFLKQLLAAGDLQFTPAPFTMQPGEEDESAAPARPVEIVSEPAKRGWPQVAAIVALILVCVVAAYFALRG